MAFTLCVFAVSVSACADRIAAPEARGPTSAGRTRVQAAPATSAGADLTRGTGTWVGDGNVYFECLGEVAYVHNEMPFRWQQVVTPSGNVLFHDPFIANAGTGRTVGLTSGTIWTLDRVVSPDIVNATAGVEMHFVAVLHWVSETGPSFTAKNTYRFVQNANGDVTVNSFESRCILTGPHA